MEHDNYILKKIKLKARNNDLISFFNPRIIDPFNQEILDKIYEDGFKNRKVSEVTEPKEPLVFYFTFFTKQKYF